MASRSMATAVLAFFLVVGAWLSSCSADLDKDRDECANQLVGLAPCLPYVGGDSHLPTIDCCTGLKEILDKSRKCVCVLIRDRNDPNLGVKINGTLALSLPSACHAPTNITQCIDLLHLSPNSTEAKIFKVSSSTSNSSSLATAPISNVTVSSTSSGSSANSESLGTKINRGLGLKIAAAAAVLWFLTPNHSVLF